MVHIVQAQTITKTSLHALTLPCSERMLAAGRPVSAAAAAAAPTRAAARGWADPRSAPAADISTSGAENPAYVSRCTTCSPFRTGCHASQLNLLMGLRFLSGSLHLKSAVHLASSTQMMCIVSCRKPASAVRTPGSGRRSACRSCRTAPPWHGPGPPGPGRRG